MDLGRLDWMEKEKRFFGINLVLSIIFFGAFIFNFHFSTDDYCFLYEQKNIAVGVVSQSYRNCIGILYYVLDLIGVNVTRYQVFFGILFIVSAAWSITKITCEIVTLMDGAEGKAWLVHLGTICIFLNAFVSEWLYFAEGYLQWTLSVTGVTYACVYMIKDRQAKKNWCIALLFLFIAAGSYQISISIYVYIVMGMIYIQQKGVICKKSFLAVIRAATAAVLAVLGNVLAAKLLVHIGIAAEGTSRISFSMTEFLSVIRQILPFQKELWIHGEGVLPYTVMFVVFVLLAVLLGINLKMKKAGFLSCIFICIVALSGQMVLYLTIAAQGFFWMPMREAVPVFSIYAVLIWLNVYYSSGMGRMQKTAAAVIVLFIGCNFFAVQRLAADLLVTNAADQAYAEQVENYIHIYEENNGITVHKVGFQMDANPAYKYYGLLKTDYFGEFALKAFTREWSDLHAFNYYTGRNFVKAEVPSHIQTLISSKDWGNIVLEEQMFFEGDAVYIAVY